MASPLLASLSPAPACSFRGLQPTSCISVGSLSNIFSSFRIQCRASIVMCDETVVRRSANYQPPIWDYDFVQSLKNEYVGESQGKRIEKLKGDVSVKLQKMVDVDSFHQLDFVDTSQRLGISYHFEEEIKRILNMVYNNSYNRSYD